MLLDRKKSFSIVVINWSLKIKKNILCDGHLVENWNKSQYNKLYSTGHFHEWIRVNVTIWEPPTWITDSCRTTTITPRTTVSILSVFGIFYPLLPFTLTLCCCCCCCYNKHACAYVFCTLIRELLYYNTYQSTRAMEIQ